MILVTGGTGTLGSRLTPLLRERGWPVRVLTRDPARAADLAGSLVQLVAGNVRDPGVVAHAVAGARTVIMAAHGFTGRGDENPRTVDAQGTHLLVSAARSAGVEQFILVSVHGAAPDHPMDLMRMKYQAEQEVQASGLAWTIIRPTAYMQTWGRLIGTPLVASGRTRNFGHGANPINFVSADDVARVVVQAVTDPVLRGRVVEVAGPENLTMRQFAQAFAVASGRGSQVSAVPLPLMRLMAALLRPLNPTLARQIQAGVVMDTTDMAFSPAESSVPSAVIGPTRLAEVVRRDALGGAGARHPLKVRAQ